MSNSRLGNGILTTGPSEEKRHFVFITKIRKALRGGIEALDGLHRMGGC